MTIVGLHHVQVNVAATLADEARRFYEQTLGFERMPRPESLSNAGRSGMWYRCGEGELHVFFNPDPNVQPENSSRHPAFLVNNLGALHDQLEAAGVDLEEAIPIDGRERFFCRDPFGNRLEFLSFG